MITNRSGSDRLKPGAFLGISSCVDHRLVRPGYIKKMVDSLTLERRKLEEARTSLIMYEYSLQFYSLLILFFKVLRNNYGSRQTLQKHIEMRGITTLLKNKKVLLNDAFARKFINCMVNKVVGFIIDKKQAQKLWVEKEEYAREICYKVINDINKKRKSLDIQNLTEEEIVSQDDKMDEALFGAYTEQVRIFSEVKDQQQGFNFLKCIPSLSEIFDASDVLRSSEICSSIRSAVEISRVDAIELEMLLKYIILGNSVDVIKVNFLFSALKNCLKNIYCKIAENFVDVRESRSSSSDIHQVQLHEQIGVICKNLVKVSMPAEDICNMYTEIYYTLSLRFNMISKEIEDLLIAVFIGNEKGEVEEFKKKDIIRSLYDCQLKSIYSIIEADCCCADLLFVNRRVKSVIMSLCVQRDDIIDHMSNVEKLLISAAKYQDIVADFVSHDVPVSNEDLLLKCDNITQLKKSLKSGERVNSSVATILTEDLGVIDSQIQKLEESLNMLISRRCVRAGSCIV